MVKIAVRHVQVMFLFTNSALMYLIRFHIAETILAMTKGTENNSDFLIFDWNEKQKSLIISSFYWGLLATQIPSAYLVRRYNAKVTLFVSTLTMGLLAVLVPFCLPWGGWKMFCVLRALQGLFQGCHYPAFTQHLAKWSPMHERGLFAGLSFSGCYCGDVLAMSIGGMIAVSPLGWPGTFYISAALCFGWCVLWSLFGADDFTTSKFITLAERQMIESSLRNSVDFSEKQLKIPWHGILRSAPFWSLFIVRSTTCFSSYTLVYYFPTYMNGIFNFSMEDNALYSSLSYIPSWLSVYIFTYFGEWLMRRKWFSITTQRKFFNSIGCWLPAAFALWMAFIDEKQKVLLVVLFTLLMFTVTAVTLGSDVNEIDIAPNYVAVLTTLINFGVVTASMLGPIFVGSIVSDEHNRFQWQIVLTVFAVVFCLGDVVFLIWGTSNEEPWNSVNSVKTTTDDVDSNHHREEINLAFTEDN